MSCVKYFSIWLKFFLAKFRRLLNESEAALRVLCSLLVYIVLASAVGFIAITPTWAPERLTTPDFMVCAKVNGVIYDLSKKYLLYWPAYKGGRSTFDRVTGEKECGVDTVSIHMAISWPEIKPVSHQQALSLSFSGVLVALQPWSSREAGLRRRLRDYLDKADLEKAEFAVYNEILGFSAVEIGRNGGPLERRLIYWLQSGERTEYVGYCKWISSRSRYTRCYLEFLISNDSAIVRIELPWRRLQEWRAITSSVIELINDGSLLN